MAMPAPRGLIFDEGRSAQYCILPLLYRSVVVDDGKKLIGLSGPGVDALRPLGPGFVGITPQQANHFFENFFLWVICGDDE